MPRPRRCLARRLGRSAAASRVRRRASRVPRVRRRGRRRDRRDRRRDPQRAGRLDRDDLGGSGLAPPRPRDRRLTAGRRSTRPRTPAAGRSSWSRRTPAGRLYERTRVRGPDVVPDPRGARSPAGGRAIPRGPAVRPDDLAAMAALDAARHRRGPTRHLLTAFAAPGTRPRVSSAPTGRSAASSSGRRGAAGRRSRPTSTTRWRSCDARRVAAGPERRVRAGLAGRERGGSGAPRGDGWTEAWQAPRLIRGDPLDWRPDGDLGPVQPRDGLSRAGTDWPHRPVRPTDGGWSGAPSGRDAAGRG